MVGPPADAKLLETRDLHVAYGGIEAVRGVTIDVAPGEIVTLIGANGAGKTTILRTISGLLRPTRGEIALRGRRIDQMPAHEIVRAGIGHSPEGRRVFPRLSVQENLEMGAFARRDERVTADYERVHALFPVLKERAEQAAGTLSGGEQQMLAIGRALMGGPSLLMLDEPSLGLAPRLVALIFETLAEINAQGTTVLLVEQNAQMALSLAQRGYVIETGEIVLTDTGKNLLGSDQVRKAYLGEE